MKHVTQMKELKLSLCAEVIMGHVKHLKYSPKLPTEIMNSATSQDTWSTYKDLLNFYIQKVNYWNPKFNKSKQAIDTGNN